MLTIDEGLCRFSDGSSIGYNCHVDELPELFDEDCEQLIFDDEHKNVLFGQKKFKIVLKAGIFDKTLKFDGPTPVWEIFTKIHEFFSAPITEEQYERLEENGELRNWNRHMFPNWQSFKAGVKTIGALRGDHVAWAGLDEIIKGVYRAEWDS